MFVAQRSPLLFHPSLYHLCYCNPKINFDIPPSEFYRSQKLVGFTTNQGCRVHGIPLIAVLFASGETEGSIMYTAS